MTDPKPSTNDILAKIRAKSAAAKPTEAEPSAPEAQPQAPAKAAKAQQESTATGGEAAASPKSAPASGTAAILAAIKKPAASVAAPAAPKSPADIMAAIRGKGAAPAAPAPAVAASAKPAPQGDSVKAEPAVAAGLSAADMIRAARQAAEGSPGVPKVVLPSKPLASKGAPASVAKPAAAEVPRRSVIQAVVATILSPVFIAWSSFVSAITVSALATARFMMPNVLVEPPTKFKIGPPNDYAPGTVSTKWQAQFNIWVVNAEVDGVQMIYALSTVCTHLGCTPNWLEGEQKFKCPCHGSGFYKTGVNFEGPAPRPLERVGIRLAEDGMLEVDKSVKFQKELGQWSNPSSYV